jgi:hypothetical protein
MGAGNLFLLNVPVFDPHRLSIVSKYLPEYLYDPPGSDYLWESLGFIVILFHGGHPCRYLFMNRYVC